MRLRIHHPLVVGFFGVIGLLVALILILVGSALRAELNEVYQRDVTRQLSLAAAIVDAMPGLDADSLARLITARAGSRVTIIDTEGVVLGDSYVERGDLGAVENHIDRPEVQRLLEGDSISFARRSSATVGRSLLYGAVRSEVMGQPVFLRIAMPQDDVDRAVGQVRRAVALIGIGMMFAALLAAYGVSKVFTRPLVELSDRARRLAKGDFTGRVPVGQIAELQDLGMAFNRLTDELRNRLGELGRERDEMETLIDCMAEGVIALTDDGRVLRVNRAAHIMLGVGEVPTLAPVGSVIRHEALRTALESSVSLEAQSSEIQIGTRHLLLASRALDSGGAVTTLLDITELRRLEKVRRDFVANASHELKTPLTAIRGFAETLAEDDPPGELRGQFLNAIRVNTMRLSRLVDDLLDLSRLESGGWKPRQEAVEISEVVSEVWELLDAGVEPKAALTMDGDAVVRGDREGLFQIFRNLIENSLRHTDASGHIDVGFERLESGFARVTVTDDGEGIPLKALPRVFERFYRADSSRARDAGGTGLGLAIVKHLVLSMGGEVEARSVLGQGTTVSFTLPLAEKE